MKRCRRGLVSKSEQNVRPVRNSGAFLDYSRRDPVEYK